MKRPLRLAGRLAAIVGCLAWQVLLLAGDMARRPPGTAAAVRSLVARRLSRAAEALGPAWIKLLQILSARPDLLAGEWIAAFSRLREQVRPMPADLVRHLVSLELRRPWATCLRCINDEPAGCGSIAQVHRAITLDGREVALKVRRPEVADQVQCDSDLLEGGARLIGRLPGMALIPVLSMVRDLLGPVREQVDLALEAERLRKARQNFFGIEGIRIPAVVDQLTTPGLLTMEYLDHLLSIEMPAMAEAERRRAALVGLRALYRMIFQHGLVHADMHPGNVFVRPGGEFVMLDFGLVATLDKGLRRDYADFFLGLVNNDGAVCADILLRLATGRGARFREAEFRRDVAALVQRHTGRRSGDFEVAGFVADLVATQRRHGVRGSTRFIMVTLAMAVFDGICKQLYGACDFQREATAFVLAARFSGPDLDDSSSRIEWPYPRDASRRPISA